METTEIIKVLGIIYFVSLGFIYAFAAKTGPPFVLPGDIYIHKAAKRIYIPLGSAAILTVVIYLILRGLMNRFAPPQPADSLYME